MKKYRDLLYSYRTEAESIEEAHRLLNNMRQEYQLLEIYYSDIEEVKDEKISMD